MFGIGIPKLNKQSCDKWLMVEHL